MSENSILRLGRAYPLGVLKVVLALFWLLVLCLLAAAALHPDTGFLLHSEPLWRAFGLVAYFGSLLLPLVALAAAIRVACRWAAATVRHARGA